MNQEITTPLLDRVSMPIMVMWDVEDEVFMRPVDDLEKIGKIKLNGVKPNKIIIPEPRNDYKTQKVCKKAIAHNGLVLSTGGHKIYDGRRSKLKNKVKIVS